MPNAELGIEVGQIFSISVMTAALCHWFKGMQNVGLLEGQHFDNAVVRQCVGTQEENQMFSTLKQHAALENSALLMPK